MFIQRSPECIVRVMGFESTTWRLASNGWEFALHELDEFDPLGGATMLMKHAKSAVYIISRLVYGSLRDAALHEGRGPRGMPIFEAYRFMRGDCFVEAVPSFKFTRIDAGASWPESSVAMSRGERRAIESLGFFRKWEDQVEEIIVDQESVSQLMEKIRRLQEPELAAIRERNRLRDSRTSNQPAERVSAQIIAIAA